VRGTLLGRHSDPGKTNDKEDLREGEVEEAEILAKLRTMRRDGVAARLSRSHGGLVFIGGWLLATGFWRAL